MITSKLNFIISLSMISIIATLFAGCGMVKETRQIQLFNKDWRFHSGEINDAQKPEYNDSSMDKGECTS